MSLLAQINEKHMKLLKEEENEKQNASIAGYSINGSRKNNNDEEDFNTLLNNYAKSKSKFDQYYKTLNPDQSKKYRDEFKRQEE